MKFFICMFASMITSCSLFILNETINTKESNLISCDNSGLALLINIEGKITDGPVNNGQSIGDLQNPQTIQYASNFDGTFDGGSPEPGGVVSYSVSENFYTLEVNKGIGEFGFNLFVADPTQKLIGSMTIKGVFFDIDDPFQPGTTWKVEGDCKVFNDGQGNILIKTIN